MNNDSVVIKKTLPNIVLFFCLGFFGGIGLLHVAEDIFAQEKEQFSDRYQHTYDLIENRLSVDAFIVYSIHEFAKTKKKTPEEIVLELKRLQNSLGLFDWYRQDDYDRLQEWAVKKALGDSLVGKK